MKIVVTAATINEWMPASKIIGNRPDIQFHKSGVGMLATAVSLTKLIFEEKPDLIIQVGIAGTFDQELLLGKVVSVSNETIGDIGVMEGGRWKDIFEMGLEQDDNYPYKNRLLPNEWLTKFNLLKLDEVNAITINEISTDEEHIHQLIKTYSPTIESMEGAALHYVCREMNIPFLQVRSISNYVGERDKTEWQIKLAIDNLNEVILKLIEELHKTV